MGDHSGVASALQTATSWPFTLVLSRLGLAVAIGVFVGLEREHSGKAGVRTFSLTALLGCLAGLSGELLTMTAMGFVAILVVLMNWRRMATSGKLAMTTSVALMVVAFCSVLCGQGHVFTPVAGGVTTAALLAWKEPISGFVHILTVKELRAAILLAILSFVILPVLPAHPVDPWGLVEPQSNWASVVLIAAIAFVNYILLRILGPRGMEITAFFGGLVNSRKVIVEMITRLKEGGPALLPVAYRGIMLATGAMALRNGAIVAILAPRAAAHCIASLGLMLLASVALLRRSVDPPDSGPVEPLALESPFKLSAALTFGLVFLGLNVVGALAQRTFGPASFYFVSAAGGLLSSASSIASAATLIGKNEVPVATGVNGVVLSSITSILINIPLIRKMSVTPSFRHQTTLALIVVALAGLLGVVVNDAVFPLIPRLLARRF
ncbi:MgtC/SapB family protein [Singulisphaera acidiphila]|uniref:Putative membrane protein n=1 Tax=Singulisphaera acidiphila (strain ATCC BAA-1392 / DSM 18658 / VKM B-2454 / MOB10) TaxID=886293 RepID=L0DIR4_SINAD|nr:MgtC/SapB family protein [Singulisphaera acidiphila]AGA28708.1 putative membrane protein [Singulisphaera acidiphila DSM 18658]